MVGATYHQIGNPIKTVSYAVMSGSFPAMAGRDALFFISMLERLFGSVQIRFGIGRIGLNFK